MVNVLEAIRIKPEVRSALWHYKIRHGKKSLSAAIRDALERLQEYEV